MSSDEDVYWSETEDYLNVYEDDIASEDSEVESLFDLSDSEGSECRPDSRRSGQTEQHRSIPDGNVKTGPPVHNPMQAPVNREVNQLASPARGPLLYEGPPRGSGSSNLPQGLDREVGDGSGTGQAGGGCVQSGSQCRHQETLRPTQSYTSWPPDRDCAASPCASLKPGTRKRKPHWTLEEEEYWSPAKRRRTYEAEVRVSQWVNPLLHSLAEQNDSPQSIDAVNHVSAQGADQERGGDVQPGSLCPHQKPLRATQSCLQIRSPPGRDRPASACASPNPGARKRKLNLALDEEESWSSAKRQRISAPSAGISRWVNRLLPSLAQQNDGSESIDVVKDVSEQGAGQSGHLLAAKTRRAIRFDPDKEEPTLTLDLSRSLPSQHLPATRRIHYNAANTTRCGADIQCRGNVCTSHEGVKGRPSVVKTYRNGPPSSAEIRRRLQARRVRFAPQ